jgi:hypothetical protein
MYGQGKPTKGTFLIAGINDSDRSIVCAVAVGDDDRLIAYTMTVGTAPTERAFLIAGIDDSDGSIACAAAV